MLFSGYDAALRKPCRGLIFCCCCFAFRLLGATQTSPWGAKKQTAHDFWPGRQGCRWTTGAASTRGQGQRSFGACSFRLNSHFNLKGTRCCPSTYCRSHFASTRIFRWIMMNRNWIIITIFGCPDEHSRQQYLHFECHLCCIYNQLLSQPVDSQPPRGQRYAQGMEFVPCTMHLFFL